MCISFAWSVTWLSTDALAQTQAQHDRLDELAQFAVVGPMCKKLGFEIAPDFEQRIGPVVEAEIATWGGDQAQLKSASVEAVQRQSQILTTDLQFFSDHATTDQELRDIKRVLIRYGGACQRAANDRVFREFISVPAAFDLDRAAAAETDRMLEDGGLASWQTPLIAARGDMTMIAGACRHVIGPDKSDALLAKYGRSEVLRERAYYRRSFDLGMSDPELTAFTQRQCVTAITNYERKIAKMDR
jgi:hypothetical protein